VSPRTRAAWILTWACVIGIVAISALTLVGDYDGHWAVGSVFLILGAVLVLLCLTGPRGRRSAAPADHDAELGYLCQMAELRDTTLPRARYILEQDRATLPDTLFNRGVIRATADYIRELEAGAAAGERS
jgi:hypothetical protein